MQQIQYNQEKKKKKKSLTKKRKKKVTNAHISQWSEGVTNIIFGLSHFLTYFDSFKLKMKNKAIIKI